MELCEAPEKQPSFSCIAIAPRALVLRCRPIGHAFCFQMNRPDHTRLDSIWKDTRPLQTPPVFPSTSTPSAPFATTPFQLSILPDGVACQTCHWSPSIFPAARINSQHFPRKLGKQPTKSNPCGKNVQEPRELSFFILQFEFHCRKLEKIKIIKKKTFHDVDKKFFSLKWNFPNVLRTNCYLGKVHSFIPPKHLDTMNKYRVKKFVSFDVSEKLSELFAQTSSLPSKLCKFDWISRV